jgi:hypothetical protein
MDGWLETQQNTLYCQTHELLTLGRGAVLPPQNPGITALEIGMAKS